MNQSWSATNLRASTGTADALAPAFQPPAETGIVSGAEVLARFADPSLADLFAPQPRAGVQSAWHGHVPFARWLVPAQHPVLVVEHFSDRAFQDVALEMGMYRAFIVNAVTFAAFEEARKYLSL